MAEPNVFAEVWERGVALGPVSVRGSRLGAAAGAERYVDGETNGEPTR